MTDLIEILAETVVDAAIANGTLSQGQKGWALEFAKRDPEEFQWYIDNRPNRIGLEQEVYISYLHRRIESLEAENASQCGAIRALQRHNMPPPPLSKIPRWQSHKIVAADKIVAAIDESPSMYGHWDLLCGVSTPVSLQLAHRVPEGINPVGGYYIRYEDGFESWSPAETFERGYTRLPA